MDFFAIMSPRLGCLITGNFVQKFFQSAFAISLTHSNLHRSNARWALFLQRNKPEAAIYPCVASARWKSPESYLHGPGTGITNLPSFSAMKFSLVLLELPLASFFSTLM